MDITVLNFRLFVSFHGTLETYPEGWAIGPLGEGLEGFGYSQGFVGIEAGVPLSRVCSTCWQYQADRTATRLDRSTNSQQHLYE